MAAPSRDASMITDINVTPLVDVVLVLLVLMMVAATALANRTIALQLPKARSGGVGQSPSQPLVVAVDERGAMFLGTQPADDDAIRARAREAMQKDPGAAAVLAADGRTRHQDVVHALEILRGERIAKIAIVVQGVR